MSDINAGSVSVEVVPDARLFAEKLRAKLRDAQVQVVANADTAEAERKLDEVARTRTATVKADTKGAEKGMNNLLAAALALGPALVPVTAAVAGLGAALAAPVATAGAGLTVFGFMAGKAVQQTEKQKKQIDQLAKSVQSARDALHQTRASSAASLANSNAAAQRSAAMSLQTAEQSAQRSIASARQSLATAKTASARASAQQRIQAAEQALATRKQQIAQSVANSQAGVAASASASQAAAQRKLNDALAQYHNALHALAPSQKAFLDAQDSLKASFQTFLDKSGSTLLGPLTQGMHDLVGVLPSLSPLLKSTSGGLSTLLGDLDQSVKSGTLHDFLDFASKMAGPSIVGAGHALGDIATGVEGLVRASAPLAGGVERGILGLTDRFAKWGQNAGSNNFQDFLSYAHKEGPQVAQTLGDIAGAFGAIAKDAAPVGSVVLKGIDELAKLLHSIADSKAGPTLIAAAAGFAAVKKAMQLGGAIKDSSLVTKLLGRSAAGSLGKFAVTEAGGAIPKGVVPVFVTNKGFGGGGLIGNAEKVGAGGVAAGLGTVASFAIGGAVAIYAGSVALSNKGGFNNADAVHKYQQTHGGAMPDPNWTRGWRDYGGGRTNIPYQYQSPELQRQVKAYHDQLASVATQLVANKQDAANYSRTLAQVPKSIRTQVWLPGIDQTSKQLRAYDQMLERLNGKVVKTYLQQLVTKGPVAGGGHPIYARAAGGPVNAGQPYLVGEQGPEMLVPNQSGRIIPARQTAQMIGRSGGVDVHLHGDVQVADSREFLRFVQMRSRNAASGVLEG